MSDARQLALKAMITTVLKEMDIRQGVRDNQTVRHPRGGALHTAKPAKPATSPHKLTAWQPTVGRRMYVM